MIKIYRVEDSDIYKLNYLYTFSVKNIDYYILKKIETEFEVLYFIIDFKNIVTSEKYIEIKNKNTHKYCRIHITAAKYRADNYSISTVCKFSDNSTLNLIVMTKEDDYYLFSYEKNFLYKVQHKDIGIINNMSRLEI